MIHDRFSHTHPAVGFLFFLLVIGITSFVQHPAISLTSLISGLAYSFITSHENKLWLKALIPLMLLTAVINPLFSHEGATILTYFPNGNPLTLESIICGFSSSLTLCAVVCWFMSFGRVMTSDKFIWLFGRIVPVLSLLLSMILRFVPKFISRMEESSEVNALIENSDNSKLGKIKSSVNVFSGCITWALQSSVTTAESMKSRGFGLKGRTAYTNYRLSGYDKYILLWLSLSGIFIVSAYFEGGMYFRFYPTVKSVEVSRLSITAIFVFFLTSLTPVFLNLSEVVKCKKSK